MGRARQLFAQSESESSGDDEDPGGEQAAPSTSDTEQEQPSAAGSIPTPKEAASVLVQRFQALLRAGRHSSGATYQLAVHYGRMSDQDWKLLELAARKARGWSVERHRIGADQYEVKARYCWSTLEGGPSSERSASEQRLLLARADAASQSVVSSSLKRQRAAADAPPPLSAAECERNARRVVARHLWLLARQSKTCGLDDLLEQVLLHSDLAEEAALAALEQIVIRRDKLQKHAVRIQGDTLHLVPPAPCEPSGA